MDEKSLHILYGMKLKIEIMKIKISVESPQYQIQGVLMVSVCYVSQVLVKNFDMLALCFLLFDSKYSY